MVVLACKREKCDQPEPTLEFVEYVYLPDDPNDIRTTDTLTLTFKFTDCQGDVGITDGSDVKNLQTVLFEQINGEWREFVPLDSSFTNLLYAQVPGSKKIKIGERIEGILEQPLGSIKQNSDTIRFETKLLDQEGNESETIVTPTFIFPN